MHPSAKPNPWLELLITVALPALVLMQLSSASRLGPVGALQLALAFPLGYGGWRLLLERRVNLMAGLGVVSTLLTGGIGLLALDAQWLAVKEAAIPGVIGVAVLVSARTRHPLVRLLVFNRTLFDVDRVQQALRSRGTEAFNAELARMTVLSYPVIAIPSMVMMMAVLYFLSRSANQLTGLTLEQMLHASADKA